MRRWFAFVGVQLACLLPALCHAGELEIAGLVTGYWNGLVDRDAISVPTPYTGQFAWNAATRRASIRIDAPEITAALLDEFAYRDEVYPLALSEEYTFGFSDEGFVMETTEGVVADLEGGSPFTGVFNLFDLSFDHATGAGHWSFSQSCIVCEFIGLFGITGTIGPVPEPQSAMLLLVSGGVSMWQARRRRRGALV